MFGSYAAVAESADAADLKSAVFRRVGSSPTSRTNKNNFKSEGYYEKQKLCCIGMWY